ncbi:MAG: phospho-sugar mutase [Thermoleophilia bacterium]|nr:phospho-sugar mutase [Thermoleophilia bacterium]
MADSDSELIALAEAWIDADPDPATAAELRELVAASRLDELRLRFGGRLAFGTAGVRGPMRGGPMGMNRLVVRQTAAGIARHLNATLPRPAVVVVAYDARHNSATFAADCAEVLSAHGISVVRGREPLPTPVGVFALRHLHADAGIVITASHNPAADNGIKLYMGDGAQIIPPVDGQIAAAIDAVVADGVVTPDLGTAGEVADLGREVIDAYLATTVHRVPACSSHVRVATTAMHGVGGRLLRRALADAGFEDVVFVAEQDAPDPDFPTVAFPNPEEPGATDLLARRMTAVGADLGLALDPDADRIAVLVKGRDGIPVQLTGDDVGCLLADWLLASVVHGHDERLVVNSVVSSTLLAAIADARDARHAETLTGFKWLSRPAMEHPEWTQVLAYEEALGYAIGAEVRDKDGISAGLAVASMASAAHLRDRTLLEDLDDLHRRHGVHLVSNFSIRDESPGAAERRATIVARLSETPPERIGGVAVTGVAMLAHDVVRVTLEDTLRVVIRPSGTEPKLKCYCEAVEPVPEHDVREARDRATARIAAIRPALVELVARPEAPSHV